MTYELNVSVETFDDVFDFRNVEKLEHKNVYLRIFFFNGDVVCFSMSDILSVSVDVVEIECVL